MKQARKTQNVMRHFDTRNGMAMSPIIPIRRTGGENLSTPGIASVGQQSRGKHRSPRRPRPQECASPDTHVTRSEPAASCLYRGAAY
jgi:hypothetical protein